MFDCHWLADSVGSHAQHDGGLLAMVLPSVGIGDQEFAR